MGASLHVADVHGDGDAAEVADAAQLLLRAVRVAHGHEAHDLVQLVHRLQGAFTDLFIIIMKNFNRVTMAQSAANWRNTHTRMFFSKYSWRCTVMGRGGG